jgi:putative PIN family toxin of toxin-antitoxin system
MQNEVIILDSNIWISYVISKRLAILVQIIQKNQLTILSSQHLVKEIQDVLKRAKFKKYISNSDVKEVIIIHQKLCRFVETNETTNQLTDIKDNFLLHLYDKGKATMIVSGDKNLLHEAAQLNYRVSTLRDFELSVNF